MNNSRRQAMSAALRPAGMLTASALLLFAVSACSIFSQTPDPKDRSAVRNAVPYGTSAEAAASRLSGLGYSCSRRQGEYTDESGHSHSADHLLLCEERPNTVSFTCENRNQVTLVLRDEQVSGIEVTRGPSCQRN